MIHTNLKMNKLFLHLNLFTTVFILLLNTAHAQEKTATKSASSPSAKESTTSAATDDKVKNLKDKLATTVAQLREDQTRGFYGDISALSKSSFTLSTIDSEIKVRFNEDTLVFKSTDKRTDATIGNLKNGLTASVMGLFDKDTSIHTAKVILLQVLPHRYSGQVTQVDKTNATLTLKTTIGKDMTFDYEKTTRAVELQISDKKLVKSGLSRINNGDRVEIWANVSEDDQQKNKAVRLVRIPKELFDDKANAVAVSPTPQASPKTPENSPAAVPKTSPKATVKP